MFSTERSKGERNGAVRNRTQKGQNQGKERERRRQEGEEWHGKVVSLYCIQGDQIGRNFAIWAIFYGVGQIFFLEKVAQ